MSRCPAREAPSHYMIDKVFIKEVATQELVDPNSVTSSQSQSTEARAAMGVHEMERSIEVSLASPAHLEYIIDNEGRIFHGGKTFCSLLDQSEVEKIPEPTTTSPEPSTTTARTTSTAATATSSSKRENVSTDTTTFETKSKFAQEISRFSASALSPSPSTPSSTYSPSQSPTTTDSDSDSSTTTAPCRSRPQRKFVTAQQLVQGERSEYEKIRAANINKDKEELLQTLQRDWKAFKESEGLVTGGESQKGATKLKALERKAGSTRKSSVSNDVKVKKNRPAGLVTNKSVKGSRAVMVNCQEEEEAGAAPFTEGQDILVHLEDGLIYLGVVIEVKEEQGQCLVHFGDGTERWSTFNQLQRLGEISDDECTPTSITERPEPVDSEEESSEIKIDSQASGKSEQSVEIPTGDKRFSCSSCDHFCSTATNLRIHTRVHTGEKPYSCTKCDYTCAHSYSLTYHTRRIHPCEKPYRCKKCDYSCSHADDLKKHKRIHTGENSYSCTKCDYSCFSSTYLKVHMRVHTGEKPYSCTKCEYSCSTSKYLKIHMRVHTGEKPYSCTKCDYSCSQSSSLSRHMSVHNGEKPFSCAQCPYRCSHKHILKRHILGVHSGEEKSYSCTKCNYSCSRSDHFTAHMKLHTGEKNHACTHCDYSTSYKSAIKRHMRKHH